MPGLSRGRWLAVGPHLDRALELSGAEREALLVSLDAEAPDVARDLRALLAAGSLDGSRFLEVAPVIPEASLEGVTLGAWTLVSPIGQGGMGSVWLARRSDGRFEGRAAVKLLNAALVGRAGEERFRREGAILARLSHPHIARLLDAGLSPTGQPYLVLEHVAGEPIDRWCDSRRLELAARLRLFLDVLDAVAHAHASLIVHRDIKPSNVLVGDDGRVRLLDFGIAKLLSAATADGEPTALTREGESVLTPEFAAPEQITGGAITTATDVHALGTLLYVLLAGRHPAGESRRSTAELVRAIVDDEPRRASEAATAEAAALRGSTAEGLRRALRGDLDLIVGRALKKAPGERYASVTAFGDDVERFLGDQPIAARPDTLAYRASKFARRHTAGVGAAVGALLLTAGLVTFYTARLARERDRARLQAQRATRASAFLSDLLTEADPYERKVPTVRDLLDAGAARVHAELAGEPELEAEMLTTIGRVYHHVGADDKAQPILEEAVAVARRGVGPGSEQAADALNNLGLVLRDRGDLSTAEKALTESLTLRRRLYGSDHKDLAVTLVELAGVYADQGRDDLAEPLLRESLAIRRRVLGPQDHETAVSMNDLALLKRRRGELAESEALFRRALAIFRKTRGEDHPNVASALGNLALVRTDRGDFAEAESLFRQALEIDRRNLGERNESVGNTWINIARPLLEENKYGEAADAARRGLEITSAAFGGDHPRIAYGELYLARADLARGDAEAAEPLARDALRIRRRTFPADDWRVGAAESALGAALTSLGRYEEAEPLLRDAQRLEKDVPGAQGQEAKATELRLAALSVARARVARP